MRIINEISYTNLGQAVISEPEWDYSFLLNTEGVFFVRSYLNKIDENYIQLTTETYDLVDYDHYSNRVFLYSSERADLDVFVLDESSDFNESKVLSIKSVFGADHIRYSRSENRIYVGNRSQSLLQSYELSLTIDKKISNTQSRDSAVLGRKCYVVGNNKLREIDLVLGGESVKKEYVSNPFRVESLQLETSGRLYIITELDLGVEERLVESDATIYRGESLLDPVDIYVGLSNEVITIFKTGDPAIDTGSTLFFRARENPADTVSAIFGSDLFLDLNSLGFDRVRGNFYTTKQGLNLVLVLSALNGPDPAALIQVGNNPSKVAFHLQSAQIIVLCENELYVIKEFEVTDSFLLPTQTATTLEVEEEEGYILVGDEAGFLYVLNISGVHILTLYPNVGKIYSITFVKGYKNFVLCSGENGLTLIDSPSKEVLFDKENSQPLVKTQDLPPGKARQVSINDNEVTCLGYLSGEIVLLDVSQEILYTYLQDGEIILIEKDQSHFFVVSATTISLINSTTFERVTETLVADAWSQIILGKRPDRSLEVMLVGTNNIVIIPYSLESNTLGVPETLSISNLSAELSNLSFTTGYYIPRENSLPSELETRDSFAFRRLIDDYLGPCIAITKELGETAEELNIYFNETGSLDETSVLNFIAGGTAYISKIYGQKGKYIATTPPNHRPFLAFNGAIFKTPKGEPEINFNGNQYLKIENALGLNLNETISFSSYIRFDSSNQFSQTVLSKGNFFLDHSENNLRWETRPGVAEGWAPLSVLGVDPISPQAFKGNLYVASRGSNSISRFDTREWSESTSQIGLNPVSLAENLDFLYIACKDSHEIYEFDELEYNKFGGFQGKRAYALLSSNDTLYVSGRDDNSIHSYTTRWLKEGEVGSQPVDFLEINNEILVACKEDSVWVLRGGLWQPTVSSGVNPVSLANYNAEAYVAAQGSKEVRKFEGLSWGLTATLPQSQPSLIQQLQNNLYLVFESQTEIYQKVGNTWERIASSLDIGGSPSKLFQYMSSIYVFCQDNNSAYRYNPSTGNWTLELELNFSTQISDLVVNGSIIIATSALDGEIHKYDGTQWSLVAQSTAGEIGTSPSTLRFFNNTYFCKTGNALWTSVNGDIWTQYHSFTDEIRDVVQYQTLTHVITNLEVWRDNSGWQLVGNSFQGSLREGVVVEGGHLFLYTSERYVYRLTESNWNTISQVYNNIQAITFSDNKIWIVASQRNPEDGKDLVYYFDINGSNIIPYGQITSPPQKLIVFNGALLCLCTDGRIFSYTTLDNNWFEVTTSALGEISEAIPDNLNNRILFTRPLNRDVYQYDGSTLSRLGDLSLGVRPVDLTIWNSRIYVICKGSNELFILSEDELQWLLLSDLSLNPDKIITHLDKLYISCESSNDVVVWDGLSVYRLDEVGYNPSKVVSFENELLVFCEGYRDISKGVYKKNGDNWVLHSQALPNPQKSIVYDGSLLVTFYDDSKVLKLSSIVSTTWETFADRSLNEIGDNPTDLLLYGNQLLLICEGSLNLYAYVQGSGWSLKAFTGEIGTPKALEEFDGFMYLLDQDGTIRKTDGDGSNWAIDENSIPGVNLVDFIKFSSKLHAFDKETGTAYVFPSYLVGNKLSKTIVPGEYVTLTAEFGSKARLFINDELIEEETPEEEAAPNNFDLFIGVGFDFSPGGNITVRSDYLRAAISEFHISSSSTLQKTDLFQSYLFSHHLLSENYFLYDEVNDIVLTIFADIDRTISQRNNVVNEPLSKIIYDKRFSILLYQSQNNVHAYSMNERFLFSQAINNINDLTLLDSFIQIRAEDSYYFLGQTVSIIPSPIFQDTASIENDIIGLEGRTSYLKRFQLPNSKEDRFLLEQFNLHFTFNPLGNQYFVESNKLLVYNQSWELLLDQSFAAVSNLRQPLFVKSNSSNNLNYDQIYALADEGIVVFSLSQTITIIKIYSSLNFNSATLINPLNEIWFIDGDGSIRRIIANKANLESIQTFIIPDLSTQLSSEDKIDYLDSEELVAITNRQEQTINFFSLRRELVNIMYISNREVAFKNSTSPAVNRVPMGLTVSKTDGLLYVLTSPTLTSQKLSQEILLIEDGKIIDVIDLPSFETIFTIKFSSSNSSIILESSTRIYVYQDKILSRTLLKYYSDKLDLKNSLKTLELISTDGGGWNPYSLGTDLVEWFDASKASFIRRKALGVDSWISTTSEAALDHVNNASPSYEDFSQIVFDGASSLITQSSSLFNSDLLHIALDIENDGKVQTIFSNNRADLSYRNEELTLTVKGEAEGFYPISGTQGSPRAMIMFQDRYYLAVAGKDEIWKYEFTSSNGQPDSLPKWQVFQSDPSLIEPEYLYEYGGKLWCCYAYSNTIASVEDALTREVFTFTSNKIRPRRMIEFNGDLFVSFFGSDHIGRYNSTDGWSFSIVGRKPYDFVIYNSQLLVSCGGDDEIWALNGSSWSVWATSEDIGEDSEARGLLVSGDFLFVACYRSNEIRRYDGISWSIDSFFGQSPLNFEVGLGSIFVCCWGSNDIYKLGSATNTNWSRVSGVAEGVYDLVFLNAPSNISLPQAGLSFSSAVYALCAEDTSGQVYYSTDGNTFSTFAGRHWLEYYPELDTLFSRHPSRNNEVVYFDGLHFKACFDSASFWSNGQDNGYQLYYYSGEMWLLHNRGMLFKSLDGINWTLERGLQATEGLYGMATVNGEMYLSERVRTSSSNTTSFLHKYEGNYQWSKIYPPIDIGDTNRLRGITANTIEYLVIGVLDFDKEDKLWVCDPMSDTWYSEFTSTSLRGVFENIQIGNYLYISVSDDNNLHEVYRANLTNYDPINGTHLNFTLIGDGSVSLGRHPLALKTLSGYLYSGCTNGEIYRISLSGDISTNTWELSASLSDRRVYSLEEYSVDGFLYALVSNNGNNNEIWRLEAGSWSQIASTGRDLSRTSGDQGLTEFQGLLYFTAQDYALYSFDGTSISSVVVDSGENSYSFGTLPVTIEGKEVLLSMLAPRNDRNMPAVFYYDPVEDRVEGLSFRVPSLFERFNQLYLKQFHLINDERIWSPVFSLEDLNNFSLMIESSLSPFFSPSDPNGRRSPSYRTEGIKRISQEIKGKVYIEMYRVDKSKRIYEWNSVDKAQKILDDNNGSAGWTGFLVADYGSDYEVWMFSDYYPYWQKNPARALNGNWERYSESGHTKAQTNHKGTPYRIQDYTLQRRDLETREWVNESFYQRRTGINLNSCGDGSLYEIEDNGGVNLYKKGEIVQRSKTIQLYPPYDKILTLSLEDIMNPSYVKGGTLTLYRDDFGLDLQGYNEEVAFNSILETEIGARADAEFLNGQIYSLMASRVVIPNQALLLHDYLATIYELPTPTPDQLIPPFLLSRRKLDIYLPEKEIGDYFVFDEKSLKKSIKEAPSNSTIIIINSFIRLTDTLEIDQSGLTLIGMPTVIEGNNLNSISINHSSNITFSKLKFQNAGDTAIKFNQHSSGLIIFNECQFFNNKGHWSSCINVTARSNFSLYVKQCQFTSNETTYNKPQYPSGTIKVESTWQVSNYNVNISNSIFYNNKSGGYRNGIFATRRGGDKNVNVTNCTFISNSTVKVLHWESLETKVTVNNCIFEGNELNKNISDFFSYNVNFSSKNIILPSSGTIEDLDYSGIQPYIEDPLVIWSNKTIQTSEDYYFRLHSAKYGTIYSLDSNSPAINAGDNNVIPEGVEKDLLGNPRIVNGTVDIGAIEVQND